MKPAQLWAVFSGLVALLILGGLALSGGTSQAAPARPGPTRPNTLISPLQEGFEDGDLSYGTQFYTATTTCPSGGCGWTTVVSPTHTGNFAAYGPEVSDISDQQLRLASALVVPTDATGAVLSFWHHFNFEAPNYDGSVLETSTDGGATWQDAGANITSGGYNGTIANGYSNPLATRAAWTSTNGTTYTQVQVNLLPYAGHNLLLRFRLGTDSSNSGLGWQVDDITVDVQAPNICGSGTWSESVTQYPTGVYGAAVVTQNDTIYSFGGNVSESATTAAYKYQGSSWTVIQPLPSPIEYASAVSDGTYLYIVGGDNSGSPSLTFWRYNPATNTYTTTLNIPTVETTRQAAAYLNGNIYKVGGHGFGSTGETFVTEVYNIAANSWTTGLDYPTALEGISLVAYNGALYAAGGGDNPSFATSAKTYRYVPGGIWDDTAIADLPSVRFSTANAFYSGRWILAGGTRAGLNTIAWNSTSNTWSSLSQTLQAVSFSSAARSDGFYAIGESYAGAFGAVERYQEGPVPHRDRDRD